jgi:hypothetical protein
MSGTSGPFGRLEGAAGVGLAFEAVEERPASVSSVGAGVLDLGVEGVGSNAGALAAL